MNVDVPGIGVVQFPDSMSEAEVIAAIQKLTGNKPKAEPEKADARNSDGTYGTPPEGMVVNPQTGQMTERDLLAGVMARNGISNTESAVGGFARGGTFGFNDEILGAANAVLPGPGTMSERYAYGRERARALEQAQEAVNPNFFLGGEVGGGVGTALTYGVPAIAGRGLLGSMAAGAGVGGAEGLAYGYGTGEGSAAERAKNAGQYGLLGLAMGGAAPVATAGAQKLWQVGSDVVGGGIDAVANRGSRGRANRALAKTVERSGMGLDDVDAALNAAAREGQPEYRAADALGISGQRRLSAVARSGGDGSAEIRNFLDRRQAGQPERVASAVEDAFDLRGGSASMAREALEQGRKGDADIAFGGIRAAGNPVDIRPVLQAIDDKVKPFKDANVKSRSARALEALRKQLAGKGKDGDYQLSDFDKVFAIRKELRDNITEAFNSGRNELARDLKAVREVLDDALSASSDEYASAMRRYQEASRVIDAVDAGKQMSRPGSRAVDNAQQFGGMTGSEQAAARTGYGDTLLSRVENQAGGSNRARPLTSPKAEADAAAIAVDPDLYARRIQREMDMFETRNVAAGGSRTADNLEDMADLQAYDMSILGNILTGRWSDASRQAASSVANVMTGMNEGTRKMIADALMAGDTQAFRAAVQQVENSQARREIVNAVIRSGILRTSDPMAVREQVLERIGIKPRSAQ